MGVVGLVWELRDNDLELQFENAGSAADMPTDIPNPHSYMNMPKWKIRAAQLKPPERNRQTIATQE